MAGARTTIKSDQRKSFKDRESAEAVANLILRITGDEIFFIEERGVWWVWRFTGKKWVLV